MRKLCLALLCIAVTIGMVAPVSAEHSINGYFRTQFISATDKGAPAKDKNASNYNQNPYGCHHDGSPMEERLGLDFALPLFL